MRDPNGRVSVAAKKKQIGFKSAEQMICDAVDERVEEQLKKVRTVVKKEVKDSIQKMEGKMREMEERMIATFGKIQGEIEMMSNIETREDHALLGRIERLEIGLMQVGKDLEQIKAVLTELSRRIGGGGEPAKGETSQTP